MDYKQFIGFLEQEVKRRAGDEVEIRIHSVIKNNGRKREGMVFFKKNINISPTIYLEEYYEQFLRGKTVPDIGQSIFEFYKSVRFQNSFEAERIQKYNAIKDKIMYRVINREKNTDLLKEIPFVAYLDLAVVFYLMIDMNAYGTATVTIRNEHLKAWQVTPKEILKEAERNTPRLLLAKLTPMNEVIAEMMQTKAVGEEDYMYVLSNQMKNFGACCIRYPQMLEQIFERLQDNYYILPSSVHEVIVLPEKRCPGREELHTMIAEINQTQVDAEEVLSDQPYYYDHSRKSLLFAKPILMMLPTTDLG